MTAKEVIDRSEQLISIRSPYEYIWSEIGYLCNARHLDRTRSPLTHGFVPHSEIYDTTLRTKSRMQANGITSMIFPRDRDWLIARPPWEWRNDKHGQKMYREAGEAVLHYLRASNFHHVNHKIITDRSQIGTGSMSMEWVKDDFGTDVMNFRKYDPLDYFIDHDSRGRVTTFGCCYEWSAAKAAEEWGIENLSSKLQKEAKDPKNGNLLRSFILLVQRRAEWEKKEGNKGMNYSFQVVEKDGNHQVQDSGIDVFPYVVSRYDVDNANSPWGTCPAWDVLPNAYKANFAAKFMMVMGERAAVPPVLAPASMKEEGVLLGAAEITYVSDSNHQVWPRELTGGGNYQVGMEVWKQMQDAIDNAYNGKLFSMFSEISGNTTATQINAMQGEHNAQINPTITALNQDHTDPVVQWAFNGLYDRGLIDLPEWAINQETGRPSLPILAYDNAITMNHKRSKALEVMGLVDTLVNLQAAGADVDVIKLKDTMIRAWRDAGQDEDEIYSEQEIQENEDRKAQQAQQAQALQAAESMAGTAKDASAAGFDVPSVVGGMQ